MGRAHPQGAVTAGIVVSVDSGSGDREVEERFVSSSTAFIGICLPNPKSDLIFGMLCLPKQKDKFTKSIARLESKSVVYSGDDWPMPGGGRFVNFKDTANLIDTLE